MKQNLTIIFISIIFCFLFSMCNSNKELTPMEQKETEQTEIIQLQYILDSLGSIGEINWQIASDFVSKVDSFSAAYPEAPETPELLYKAALTSMSLAKCTDKPEEIAKHSKRALSFFDTLIETYPEADNVKNCILNKGILYDVILQDFRSAEMLYREFIARYPSDSLAISVKTYLQYLGKTPEEIMAEIEKKKKRLKR